MSKHPTKGSPSDAYDIDNASIKLLEPGYSNLEDGYARLKDGTMFIAVLTDLGETTGEMIDWWFCNVENTERYKWWHPIDHVSGIWDATYYATPATERKPGHYIGHTHIVQEKVGGKLRKVNLNFSRPSRFFDVKAFPAAGITACLCARVYIDDPPFGFVAVGYVIHTVRRTPEGKNEMRSRFWLGDLHQDPTGFKILTGRIINYFGNTYWNRMLRATTTIAEGLYIHCYQEMSCLGNFLPHYYNSEMQKRLNEAIKLEDI